MKLQRVICLYRVSTKKQVDKNENDIPMQKTACWDFASSKPDWTIVKEYSEKGISGYKVSADDRDAIQELKEAALNDEFDILLVFMFDRIGRIDDETPFVVEWFAKHGIQVWSVMEGQQRFDSHVDKLMNYLRFWQASGESEKTSMRIKSKMQQMMEDGLYTGGPVKYGYHLIDSGLVNRKGIPIKKYAIDAVAAAQATKATAKAVANAVKAVIAALKTLIFAIMAGGWIVVLILLVVILFGGLLSMVGGSNASTVTPVSAEVEAYEPLIRQYARQYGIEEYVELIKAVMMQESISATRYSIFVRGISLVVKCGWMILHPAIYIHPVL